ncbi:MAG: AAA family ATPase [Pseudobdellovibrio sp.]
MSFLSKISSGVVKSKNMNVLYGERGLGKSWFISAYPNLLLLDIEDGSKNIPHANRLSAENLPNYSAILDFLNEFELNDNGFKALGLDSITSLEKYILKHVCEEKGITDFTDVPFKVKDLVNAELSNFLNRLKALQDKGYEIWLTGHALTKKFNDPTLFGQYDKFTIETSDEKIAKEIIRLSDNVYFVKQDVSVATDKTKKGKGISDGTVSMFTRWQPAYDAKTRINLPSQIKFDIDTYLKCVNDNRPKPATELYEDIKSLILKLKPHDAATAQIAIEKLEAAKNDGSKLQIIKNKLIEATKDL